MRGGATKPDRAIFDVALERPPTAPERAVLVDDQQSYCDGPPRSGSTRSASTGRRDRAGRRSPRCRRTSDAPGTYSLSWDIVALAAAVVAVVALVVAVAALRFGLLRRGDGVDALPEDVQGLRQEVAALRAESKRRTAAPGGRAVRRLGDMGGHLSWSLALLDDRGSRWC